MGGVTKKLIVGLLFKDVFDIAYSDAEFKLEAGWLIIRSGASTEKGYPAPVAFAISHVLYVRTEDGE